MKRSNRLWQMMQTEDGLSPEAVQRVIDWLIGDPQLRAWLQEQVSRRSLLSNILPERPTPGDVRRLVAYVYECGYWNKPSFQLTPSQESAVEFYFNPTNLQNWLGVLDEQELQVVVLRSGLGKPMNFLRQVREQLSISIGVIRTTEARARKKLRIQAAHRIRAESVGQDPLGLPISVLQLPQWLEGRLSRGTDVPIRTLGDLVSRRPSELRALYIGELNSRVVWSALEVWGLSLTPEEGKA